MKVLVPGDGRKEWSARALCTGHGNYGGGCGAQLLVNYSDLFLTASHARDETETYVTFQCIQCGVLTDIQKQEVPHYDRLPSQKAWQEARKSEERLGNLRIANVRKEGAYVVWDEVWDNAVDTVRAYDLVFFHDPDYTKKNLLEMMTEMVEAHE